MSIAPTIRLYGKDPYQTNFTAKIVKIEGANIWLDQTCFFPESGGQVGDQGSIANQKVLDTKFDAEKNIVHKMEANVETLKIGDHVSCEINWPRRYQIMQLHAASHIMEYFLFQVFGQLKLLGSNLNEERDSSTYAMMEPFDLQKLQEVESLANAFIAKNLPIETYADPQKPNFRWWKCAEILMPCGGTHPRNTEEIGPIVLKRESGGKGKEKIKTFLIHKSS